MGGTLPPANPSEITSREMAMPNQPLQRIENLVVTESGDDLLVYDTTSHALHTLNPLSAEVFRRCNGTASIEDMAQETGADAHTVHLALTQLRQAGLLEVNSLVKLSPTTSRRQLLRNTGIALSLPAIVSVTVPLASAASSVTCTPPGGPCSFNDPGACCNLTCMSSNPSPVCL